MSKFYARITRSARRTQPSARGHSGVTVWAQSYAGSIKVAMWLCSETGKECYSVALHEGSAGAFVRLIAEGYADGSPFATAIGKALDAAAEQYLADKALAD